MKKVILLICVLMLIGNAYSQSDSYTSGFLPVPHIEYRKVNDSITKVFITKDTITAIKELLEYTIDLNKELAYAREVLDGVNVIALGRLWKDSNFLLASKQWIKLRDKMDKKYDFLNNKWKIKYKQP